MAEDKPSPSQKIVNDIEGYAKNFLERNPEFVKFAINKDAALNGKTTEEAKKELALYPGVIAIAAHEQAHTLYKRGQKYEARQLAETAHTLSGADIHPGAKIGPNFFMDHAVGSVIGETAVVGQNTVAYHGVTLGAYGKPESINHRHPEVGDNCVISSGAQILGNVKIGNKVKIGPGVILAGNNIVIGDGVKLGPGARVEDGNIIASGVEIGAGVIIPKNQKEVTQQKNIVIKGNIYARQELGSTKNRPSSYLELLDKAMSKAADFLAESAATASHHLS